MPLPLRIGLGNAFHSIFRPTAKPRGVKYVEAWPGGGGEEWLRGSDVRGRPSEFNARGR